MHDHSSSDMSVPISPLSYCHYCNVHGHDYFELHCGSCKSFGHEESECPLLRVRASETEDVHYLPSPSVSTPTSSLPLHEEDDSRFNAFVKKMEELLARSCEPPLDLDYKVVLDKEVHGAIMAPSPFLSEGVILIEDEPPTDAPHERVNMPNVEDDKLLSVCVHVPSSTKWFLKEIFLEFDCSYD